MKKFAFTLDRVLDWRRLQARIEEARLEKLHQQRQLLADEQTQLESEKIRLQDGMLAAPHLTGRELETWDSFRQFADAERKRLDHAIVAGQKQTETQALVVSAKRREVRLLEKLKDRRREAWTQELDKETQQLAEETFLARWKK